MDRNQMEEFMKTFAGKLTADLGENIRETVKNEIAPLVEKMLQLERTIQTQQKKIEELQGKLEQEKQNNDIEKTQNEEERRRRNIIVHNLAEENVENEEQTEEKILKLLNVNMKVKCNTEGIDYVKRIGKKGVNPRPIFVRLKCLKKKIEILKNKVLLKGTTVNVVEDYTEVVREKRKSLIPEMIQLRKEGKNAVLRRDKLVILDLENRQQEENINSKTENRPKRFKTNPRNRPKYTKF
uniref:Uncharacterized protein n=1 Tax=Cacopsylla melanoneura TaxID=428564 RepID=A0A8D8M1S8_9HEMI